MEECEYCGQLYVGDKLCNCMPEDWESEEDYLPEDDTTYLPLDF